MDYGDNLPILKTIASSSVNSSLSIDPPVRYRQETQTRHQIVTDSEIMMVTAQAAKEGAIGQVSVGLNAVTGITLTIIWAFCGRFSLERGISCSGSHGQFLFSHRLPRGSLLQDHAG